MVIILQTSQTRAGRHPHSNKEIKDPCTHLDSCIKLHYFFENWSGVDMFLERLFLEVSIQQMRKNEPMTCTIKCVFNKILVFKH